jgi:hypothetical protein
MYSGRRIWVQFMQRRFIKDELTQPRISVSVPISHMYSHCVYSGTYRLAGVFIGCVVIHWM